jgi:hypothetical protein
MEEVVKTQKQVHEFYGFKIVPELYFGWQFTTDIDDESKQSYKEAVNALDNIIDIRTLL